MNTKRFFQIFLVFMLLLSPLGSSYHASASSSSTASAKPVGNDSVQVQRGFDSGPQMFTAEETLQAQASVATVVNPASVNVGETAAATVSLQNVPAEGFTSAEFTCTYSGSLVEAGNIVVGNLFGADPVVAVNGPQNGSFIVAIAGSNGSKATTSGAPFTFSVEGLQGGQTAIECAARVSSGNSTLTAVPSTPANLIVSGPTATFTATPIESPTFTPTATASPTETSTSTPDGSPTATGSPTETFTPTPTSTATSTATPTSTPLPTDGTLTGQVLASKPVTVSLYDATPTLVASVIANTDGTFSLSAPAGTYTVRAAASGFLMAQGSTTLTAGNTNTLPTISLPAGDIDGNNVIDQFDALTIGMSYNTTTPAAADLNNDGTINVLDLELLALNYRETGPVAWE